MTNQMILENAVIVTMDSRRQVLTGESLVIQDEKIAAIGLPDEMRTRFPQAVRRDCRGKVILPGFINCHTHLAMSLQKGVTLAVPEGLYRVMWPVEKALSADDCYIGALAGAAEALKGGTTTAVDHYFYAERNAEAISSLGLRSVIGHTIMSRLGPFTGEKELEEGMDFVLRWKGKNPLIIPWLAPHASDTVDREWLMRLRRFASEQGVGLHLHLAQSPRERAFIQETYGMGCAQYLESIGFLDKDVLAAHCIFIKDEEIDLLAKSGAHPLYCPMGHALGGGPARAWEMLQRGAKVLIGTDCVTSYNVMDITGELRIAGCSQKQLSGDSMAMPALKILEMVTLDAAEAIGMGNQLGSIQPGYLADLNILDFDGLNTAPNYSLYDNIVYCCTGRDVHTVMVHGKVVVENHRLLTADESELVRMVQSTGKGLIQRAVSGDPELDYLWKSTERSV